MKRSYNSLPGMIPGSTQAVSDMKINVTARKNSGMIIEARPSVIGVSETESGTATSAPGIVNKRHEATALTEVNTGRDRHVDATGVFFGQIASFKEHFVVLN